MVCGLGWGVCCFVWLLLLLLLLGLVGDDVIQGWLFALCSLFFSLVVLVTWLLDCLIAWLLDCLIAWLLDCLIAWLLACLLSSQDPWLIDQLCHDTYIHFECKVPAFRPVPVFFQANQESAGFHPLELHQTYFSTFPKRRAYCRRCFQNTHTA